MGCFVKHTWFWGTSEKKNINFFSLWSCFLADLKSGQEWVSRRGTEGRMQCQQHVGVEDGEYVWIILSLHNVLQDSEGRIQLIYYRI